MVYSLCYVYTPRVRTVARWTSIRYHQFGSKRSRQGMKGHLLIIIQMHAFYTNHNVSFPSSVLERTGSAWIGFNEWCPVSSVVSVEVCVDNGRLFRAVYTSAEGRFTTDDLISIAMSGRPTNHVVYFNHVGFVNVKAKQKSVCPGVTQRSTPMRGYTTVMGS